MGVGVGLGFEGVELRRDWWAQDWMQGRWKTAWQEEEQDQVGSEGRMRMRQMRQAVKEEEEEERKDLIFERSPAAAMEELGFEESWLR